MPAILISLAAAWMAAFAVAAVVTRRWTPNRQLVRLVGGAILVAEVVVLATRR